MSIRTQLSVSLLGLAALAGVGMIGQACYLVDNPEYVVRVDPQGANVLLRVTTPEGEGVALALVTVAGQSALTDTAGFARFDELPEGRFVARIDARGYAPVVVVTEVSEGTAAYEQPRMLPLGEPIPFDADAATLIETDDVKLEIAPGTLRNADGEVVTGDAEATIVFLDPSTEEGLDNLPGPLQSKKDNNAHAILRSLAMAEISLWQDGEYLRLAPGARARVSLRIPAVYADQVSVGQEIGAWWLNLEDGAWESDGVGVISEDQNGDKFWVASFSHFTWLNCDLEVQWNSSQCIVTQVEGDISAPGSAMPTYALLSDVSVYLTDDALGNYKDKSTSALTGDNRGSNCLVFEMGTTPTLHAAGYTIPITQLPDYPNSVGLGGCFGDPDEDDYKEGKTNASCQPMVIQLPAEDGYKQICTPGSSRSCPGSYTGLTGTEGVGICHGDVQYCIEGGLQWSECSGQVTPQTETCTTVNIDDDCDGKTDDYDDGALCDCPNPGEQAPCYTGPTGTRGVGVCAAGTRTCESNNGTLAFGTCMSQVLPDTAEDCSTADPTLKAHDENCDGKPMCTGERQWTKPHNATINDLAVGPAGEIYAVGHFAELLSFDNKTLPEPYGDKSQDTLLLKLNPDGSLVWAKSFGGAGDDYGRGVAVSPSGDVVITGSFEDTVKFDVDQANPTSPSDKQRAAVYIAKIDADGNPVWSDVYGGQNPDGDSLGYDVAIDRASGKIYVTGIIYGEMAIGAQDTAGSDVFIISHLDDGSRNWAQGYSAPSIERASGIAIGPQGNLYMSGYFYDEIDLFNDPTKKLVTNGAHDIFVARIGSANGTPLAAVSFGSSKSDTAAGIAVDSTGTVFITGSFRDSITLKETHLVNAAAGELDHTYVLALDPELNPVWSKGYVGNAGDSQGVAIGVDARDYVLVTGFFQGLANFGGGTGGAVDSMGKKGIFTLKLENNGNHVWTSYPDDGTIRGLAVAPSGHVYLGGANLVLRHLP